MNLRNILEASNLDFTDLGKEAFGDDPWSESEAFLRNHLNIWSRSSSINTIPIGTQY